MKKRLAILGMQLFLFLAGFPLKAESVKDDLKEEPKKGQVVKAKTS